MVHWASFWLVWVGGFGVCGRVCPRMCACAHIHTHTCVCSFSIVLISGSPLVTDAAVAGGGVRAPCVRDGAFGGVLTCGDFCAVSVSQNSSQPHSCEHPLCTLCFWFLSSFFCEARGCLTRSHVREGVFAQGGGIYFPELVIPSRGHSNLSGIFAQPKFSCDMGGGRNLLNKMASPRGMEASQLTSQAELC